MTNRWPSNIGRWQLGALLAALLCGSVVRFAPTAWAQDAPRGDMVAVTTRPSDLREDPRVRAWWQVMGWGLTLLVAFLAAAIAIVVFSRRFLAYVTHERHKPTPNEDVWAMHKVPPEPDDDDA